MRAAVAGAIPNRRRPDHHSRVMFSLETGAWDKDARGAIRKLPGNRGQPELIAEVRVEAARHDDQVSLADPAIVKKDGARAINALDQCIRDDLGADIARCLRQSKDQIRAKQIESACTVNQLSALKDMVIVIADLGAANAHRAFEHEIGNTDMLQHHNGVVLQEDAAPIS